MQIGVNGFTRGAVKSRETLMQIAEAADRLGFGFFSLNDHVVVPRGIASRYPYSEEGSWAGAASGYNLEQLAALSFVAGCTHRVRLLTSVMVVPHRQPVLAAKMLSTADVLSGGRLIVGCGAGWLKEELEALEAKPFEERGRVTDETIEAFKELWTKEAPAYRGRHVRVADVLFEPKPLQKPHPPIWIGGESPAARARAARLGDAWYPGSVNPQFRLDTPARLATAWDDVRRRTEAAGRPASALALAFVVLSPVDRIAQKGHDTPRRILTGRASDMAADIAALAEVGVGHLNLTFQTGDATETVDRMQRFAEEVMPLVRTL